MTKNVQTSSNAAYWETNSSKAPQELRRPLHLNLLTAVFGDIDVALGIHCDVVRLIAEG